MCPWDPPVHQWITSELQYLSNYLILSLSLGLFLFPHNAMESSLL